MVVFTRQVSTKILQLLLLPKIHIILRKQSFAYFSDPFLYTRSNKFLFHEHNLLDACSLSCARLYVYNSVCIFCFFKSIFVFLFSMCPYFASILLYFHLYKHIGYKHVLLDVNMYCWMLTCSIGC